MALLGATHWYSHVFVHKAIGPYRRHSGFPSVRINLSPFTKDFRGEEQLK